MSENDLKKEEEELKLLIKKIDTEILKLQALLEEAESKHSNIQIAITRTGLQTIPINILSASNDSIDLVSGLRKQILDLNKSKNFLNSKLDVTIKEEELIEELKKQFGESVSLKKTMQGDFEINYHDKETDKAVLDLEKSKKTLEEIRKSYQNILEEK